MDIENLIADLLEISQKNSISHYKRDRCAAAATELSTLQDENLEMQKQLNEFSEFLCHMTGGLLSKTNYTAKEMIYAAEDYQQKMCGECDLRTELGQKEKYYEQMVDALAATESSELEQVKRERDSIEQDFRAFAKQWWEQDSGFPCRWCKFERQGGCEWKVKHPGEICAGRAFEWRGPKKEN